MNENEFWVKQVKLFFGLIAFLIACITAYNMVDSRYDSFIDVAVVKAVSEAIKNGVDPMDAKCALTHNVSSGCLITSLKQKH